MILRSIYLIFIISLFLTSCQKEETTLIDEQNDEAFSDDDLYKSLMQSITSHYAGFDDMIDRSSCFSIDFPYACYVNGYYREYENQEDLYFLEETDVIDLIYPLNITMSDYDTAFIESEESFSALRNLCATGALYDESVSCIDAIFPMTMALFYSETSSFETISVANEQDMFLYIDTLYPGTTASMNYPIYVDVNGGDLIQISNNSEFKSVAQGNIPLCE